jgi:hypothetical protein
MNYRIPENEIENFISVYWQMLREIEENTDPKKERLNAILVEGAYRLLARAGVHNGKPRWDGQHNAEYSGSAD